MPSSSYSRAPGIFRFAPRRFPVTLFRPMKRLVLLLLFVVAPIARAHDSAATDEMASAARSFLATLSPEQKAKTQIAFAEEERKNWHFIPRPRKGLPFKEMSQGQRYLAQALLSSGLSARGFQKAVSIMSLEEVLAILEKGRQGGNVRDPENYFFSIFGEPAGDGVWGWRVEGHHLSFNFTAAKGAVVSTTPSFLGTNPGEVREGERKGQRFLAAEEELGWKLVRSLTPEQSKEATIAATAPKDVFNDPKRTDFTKPEGIAQDRLNPEQQKTLAALMREYLNTHRLDVAADDWARIEKAGLEKVKFAWAGGTEAGQPHYYRVQGPTFVIEFDNVQNEANHVHALYRALDRDFGGDPLLKHHQEGHAPK
jgi:hypothetical protein